MLPGFFRRDLGAVLVKYVEDGAERRLVVRSAYLPYDSVDPPPSRELEEPVQYCENENLYLIVGFDSNAHHTAWGSTNCNDRGEALLEFLNSSNLEILNLYLMAFNLVFVPMVRCLYYTALQIVAHGCL